MANKKILFVDDDQDLVKAMTIRLKANDYHVVTATDAISAISVARKEKPDLIILDIGLPAGSGFDVMERLKLLPGPKIPVIILTAREPVVHKAMAFIEGAEDFFQKPVDNEKLLAAIQKALERAEK